MGKLGHYIPEFYLRGFTDPETPNGQEPYIWTYKFESKKWKNRGPNKVTSRKDFYIYIDKKYGRDEKVETLLSKLESSAALIIRNKIDKMEYLDDKERTIIAEFIATMMTRTAKFRNEVDSLVSEMAKFEMKKLYASSSGDLRELKEKIEKETGEKLPDDLDSSYFDPSRFKVKASRSTLLGMMLSPLIEITNIIYCMTWTFLHATDQALFITSDHPCVTFDRKSGRIDQGLLHQYVEISLPLSSRICLRAHWGEARQRHKNLSGDKVSCRIVEILNGLRIRGADKLIISCKNKFIGDQYLSNRKK